MVIYSCRRLFAVSVTAPLCLQNGRKLYIRHFLLQRYGIFFRKSFVNTKKLTTFAPAYGNKGGPNTRKKQYFRKLQQG